ncbi:MAG: isopentenyl-diphosphate Delta-isomerase [Cyclobacteriaceae bacterium]|jgi:isopentenyl-diphosphate delta-isomerase|nr:isopentenyl-diphosphate Delta-isomerase [Cyclobacteriaceae bacterium]
MDQVILVDESDNAIGTMEKLEAHQKGLLHRAFSVVLINAKGELLLQKRALTKYHSGGLWTNTCCSHQHPQEDAPVTVQRRLVEEMGIEAQLSFAYKFIYKAALDGHLTEHECDHVYVGRFDGTPSLNPHEAADWRWMSLSALQADMQRHPDRYTAWFKLIAHHPQIERAMEALPLG